MIDREGRLPRTNTLSRLRERVLVLGLLRTPVPWRQGAGGAR